VAGTVSEDTANLVEIFSSVQGEGPHVGCRTLFVRFGACDLRCAWCDSPHTWQPAAECRIELAPGSGRFRSVPNPVSLDISLAAADALDVGAHRFASLTGGEPLLQRDAVQALARALRTRGVRIHLETHGLARDALEQVLPEIDVVSMDWKLSSDVRREGRSLRDLETPFHAEHEHFLRVARGAPEVVVKLVMTDSTRDAELDELARRVAAVDSAITVILQPVTPTGSVRESPSAARLLEGLVRLSRQLSDVRLIPQTHRQIGAL